MATTEEIDWTTLSSENPDEYIRLFREHAPKEYLPEPMPVEDFDDPYRQFPQLRPVEPQLDLQDQFRLIAFQQDQQDRQMRMTELQRKREADAIRFQGMQEFENLLQNGVSPADAFLKVGRKLYSEPSDYVSAFDKFQKPVAPSIEKIDGVNFVNYGNGKYSLGPQSPTPKPFKPDPIREFLAKDDYSAAKRALAEAKKGIAVEPLQIAEAEQRLKEKRIGLENTYQESLHQPVMGDFRLAESQMQIPNELKKVNSPLSPERNAERKGDMVVVQKDGRKFRMPREKLSEAKKRGYTLVQ